MTPFRRLGSARKFTLLRRTVVCWDVDDSGTRAENELNDSSSTATGRSRPSIPVL
jgi:hypothetical protein